MPYDYSTLEDWQVYESGLDKGVLYLPSGEAVPWYGLTAVTQSETTKVNSAYYAGRKVHDIVDLDMFTGTVTAFNYPEEIYGFAGYANGIDVKNQKRPVFGLSWREKFSDGGYLYNIVGNLTFEEQQTINQTVSNRPTPLTYSWRVSAPRVLVEGFPPTAFINIDTRKADPNFVLWLEEILYGTASTPAGFTSFEQLLTDIVEYARLTVVDNGDGTWTADTPFSYISVGVDDFIIDHPYGVWLSDDRYRIGDF